MRFFVVGDVQIQCDDPHDANSEQTRQTLSWILQEMHRVRPDVFVHLGDFGESNKGVDHYSLSLMTWFLRGVADLVPQSYWLVGNHDFYTEDGSINLMKSLQPLMPVGHQVVWPWASGPAGTLFVSYLSPGSRDLWRVEAGLVFAERERTVLFSHLPVNGAMYSPGVYESKGLSADWFPAQTIVGHYHRPNPPSESQQLSGQWVWYAGSPMCRDFRDNCYGLTPEQQLRGVWLFEIHDGATTAFPVFLPNPHAKYFLSFSSQVVGGAIQDRWFTESCRLPLERTTVRVTVPPGQDATPIASLASASAVSVLREELPTTIGSVGRAIDPDTSPLTAVAQYVQSLPPERLRGLSADQLSSLGIAIVSGNYQPPS